MALETLCTPSLIFLGGKGCPALQDVQKQPCHTTACDTRSLPAGAGLPLLGTTAQTEAKPASPAATTRPHGAHS